MNPGLELNVWSTDNNSINITMSDTINADVYMCASNNCHLVARRYDILPKQ